MLTRASIDLISSASSPRLPPDACLLECHFLGKTPSRSSGNHHHTNLLSVVKRNKMIERPQHTIGKKSKVVLCVMPCFELYHTIYIYIYNSQWFIMVCQKWSLSQIKSHIYTIVSRTSTHLHVSKCPPSYFCPMC